RKVLPGHYIVVSGDGSLTEKSYWELSFRETEDHSEEEWCERIRHQLCEATRLRLMSDVPLSVFERRRGFVRGGCHDGAVDESAGYHLFDWFRCSRIRRISVCAQNCQAIPNTTSRTSCRTRCPGDCRQASVALRRTFCGLLRDSHLLCVWHRTETRDRGPWRRWRRRKFRRISTLLL